MSNDLALVNASDLSFVEDNSLNQKQLQHILKRTPAQYVHKRPAKGGGQWEYVTGGYVKKCLNLMFGWDWDFEIIKEDVMIECKEVVVKGRLTCRSNGRTIVKMQYGNKDIIFKKGTSTPLSVGNDLKAAATDCLKKCASEIGIASDIYNKEDFREVRVSNEDYSLDRLKKLYNFLDHEMISPEDNLHLQRIIEEQDKASYKKAIQLILKAQEDGKD